MTAFAELLAPTSASCVDALTPYLDRDWRAATAADLDWTCWHTAEHVLGDLYYYALQVTRSDETRDSCTTIECEESATNATLLGELPVHAELLRRAIALADPGERSLHTYGIADPDGFAAMGLVELVVHTYDLVRGFDPVSSWRPPAEVAQPAVARLFPDAPAGEPAEVLLYCCGRTGLGDLPRLTNWRWDPTVRG